MLTQLWVHQHQTVTGQLWKQPISKLLLFPAALLHALACCEKIQYVNNKYAILIKYNFTFNVAVSKPALLSLINMSNMYLINADAYYSTAYYCLL